MFSISFWLKYWYKLIKISKESIKRSKLLTKRSKILIYIEKVNIFWIFGSRSKNFNIKLIYFVIHQFFWIQSEHHLIAIIKNPNPNSNQIFNWIQWGLRNFSKFGSRSIYLHKLTVVLRHNKLLNELKPSMTVFLKQIFIRLL